MEQQTYDFGSYASFRDTVNELIDSLEQLREYASSLQLDNTAKSIGDVIAKNAGEHFEVAIVGEFKRGKVRSSTLFSVRRCFLPMSFPQLPLSTELHTARTLMLWWNTRTALPKR